MELGQPLTVEVLKLLSDDFATGVGKATRDTLLGDSNAQAVKRIAVRSSVAYSLDDKLVCICSTGNSSALSLRSLPSLVVSLVSMLSEVDVCVGSC